MLYVLIMIIFFKNGDIAPNLTSYATQDVCESIAHQIVDVAKQDDKVTDVVWSCLVNPTEAIKQGSV